MNQIINNIENKEKQIAPLVYYVRHNDLKKVKELLEKGEDPNKKGEDFRNPLALAFALKNIDCARILLENGANPNFLCGRDSLSFLAPMVEKYANEQEKAWIYTKKVYDLLKNFETDFDVKNSISGETLEEYFRSLLPSQLYFTSRVKLK